MRVDSQSRYSSNQAHALDAGDEEEEEACLALRRGNKIVRVSRVSRPKAENPENPQSGQ